MSNEVLKSGYEENEREEELKQKDEINNLQNDIIDFIPDNLPPTNNPVYNSEIFNIWEDKISLEHTVGDAGSISTLDFEKNGKTYLKVEYNDDFLQKSETWFQRKMVIDIWWDRKLYYNSDFPDESWYSKWVFKNAEFLEEIKSKFEEVKELINTKKETSSSLSNLKSQIENV